MPIDLNFQKRRRKVGKEKDIAVWGPLDPPEKLGICGTYVAVDWDICTGCGIVRLLRRRKRKRKVDEWKEMKWGKVNRKDGVLSTCLV